MNVEVGCMNRGNKTLEIILKNYIKQNGKELDYEKLEGFQLNVLTLSNAQLYKYLLEGAPVSKEHDSVALQNLIKAKVEIEHL